MLNDTRITLRGNVATTPTLRVTTSGTTMCTFRMAVTDRRWSEADQKYVDGTTSWYTVTAWRGLAGNVAASLAPGTGVVVQGRLRIRDYTWEEQPRTSADVTADVVALDLSWGTARLDPGRRRGSGGGERSQSDRAEADTLAAHTAAEVTEESRLAYAGASGDPVDGPAERDDDLGGDDGPGETPDDGEARGSDAAALAVAGVAEPF